MLVWYKIGVKEDEWFFKCLILMNSYLPSCFIISHFMKYTIVLGDSKPHLSDYMCDQSHASYKNKVLRVAMYGFPPYFIAGKDGLGGADNTLLNYLAAKMEFASKIYVTKNWVASINMVCFCSIIHR